MTTLLWQTALLLLGAYFLGAFASSAGLSSRLPPHGQQTSSPPLCPRAGLRILSRLGRLQAR